MEQSEVRSESLGQKRPLDDGVERDSSNKKARGIGLAVDVKKVAEIVLVLATIGKMRAGRKPTAVEVKMTAEAREKLAEVCKEFAPKDIFPRDAFGTIIEDLGLNRSKETRLGTRPQKMSIAEKLQLTKQKMEKAEVFPLHSATYTPPAAAETRATSHATRMYPPDKANHAPISSGSFQNLSAVVHASPANSRTLPYQLPTSEVRPGVSNSLPRSHLGRDSIASPVPRAGRPHLRSDDRSNANPAGDHRTLNTPTWSMQPQSGPAHLTNTNHHVQHRMSFGQAPASDTHNEIGKIVQKLLHPHIPEQLTWTPPSRDYMNKPLTCQTCKSTIADVDNTLVCDACERGYHLRCLHNNPKAIYGDEWHEWHCAKCLTISNGKPLPPKYGRVMRNIATPKTSSITAGIQPSLENANENSKPKFPELECNPNGKIMEDERDNLVKKSENGEGCSSSIIHDVEWAGGMLKEVDGKKYYRSCCINGTVYNVQDYALFSSTDNKFMPNKLQVMWEDNETGKKWVNVTRCFFPDDLPGGVGRPCAPESNEVYESNHEETLMAGLIHGPCEVVPPGKISEERVTRNRLRAAGATDKPKPRFLCKWFYDETKKVFRDVTC